MENEDFYDKQSTLLSNAMTAFDKYKKEKTIENEIEFKESFMKFKESADSFMEKTLSSEDFKKFKDQTDFEFD